MDSYIDPMNGQMVDDMVPADAPYASMACENAGDGVCACTDCLIDRSGCSVEQVMRCMDLLFEQNAYRVTHGYPLITLADVLPQYTA